MTLVFSLLGGLLGVGIVLLALYFTPAPPPKPKKKHTSLADSWRKLSKANRQRLLLGTLLGLAVAIFTSYPIMLVVVPASFLLIPMLLGKPSTRERDLLIALEIWARSLAGTSETGRFTLKEVIGITRGSVPTILQDPVDRLYARMSSTWSTQDALRAFADELDSAAADRVIACLIQAAEFNSGGLAKALNGAAETLSVDSKRLIDVDVERAKPRETMIVMTVIIGLVVVGLIVFSGNASLAFYRTPVGAVTMGVIIAMVVGLMAWGRMITRPVPEPRILVFSAEERDPA